MMSNNSFSKRYPIFSKILSNTNFDGFKFVFVYHLNHNNAPFLKEWVKQAQTIAIISIPYSEVKSVKNSLHKYTKIKSPLNIEEIPKLLLKICNKEQKGKIVIVEIGGYSSYITSKLKNVAFIIEDTNQGHWLHAKTQRTKSHVVISIAKTVIKKMENRIVGESIVRSLENLFQKQLPDKNFKKLTIGVISYGGIGSSVCNSLKTRNIIPFVYDLDITKMAQAYADGYKVVKKNKLLSSSDLIIACTGQPSIKIKDLVILKKNAFLFSGSSKKIEFQNLMPLIKFEKNRKNKMLQKIIYLNKSFWIGYEGQPINFLDKLKPKDFELTLSALVECFNFASKKRLANRVYTLPLKNQLKILNLYIKSIIGK